MRNIKPIRILFSHCSINQAAAAGVIYLAALPFSLPLFAAEDPAPASDAQRPAIVIRPANYDPADELAYTRLRGEVEPGKMANGRHWNTPAEDLRAADSGTSTPPAPAESGEPVSAASGIPVPRMTYSQAYAQIPFYRSEYEANPGYRHDAALELMFGVLRPVTVVRQTMPYFSRYPDLFRYRYPVYPYPYSGGGTSTLNMNWNTSLIAY
ncbi:MAG TPA: hypothetical protein VGH74_22365 [Planctomycetaceae bacterium]